MKAISAAILLAVTSLILAGCESDVPPSTDTSGADKLRRGFSGHGQVIQPDRSNDPMIGEQSRVGY